MKVPSIALATTRTIACWLMTRWDAIVAPAEIRAERKVRIVSEAVDVLTKVQTQHQQRVEWTIEQYRGLGLSESRIKALVLPLIEQGKDPLTVIRQLAARGVITGVDGFSSITAEESLAHQGPPPTSPSP